MNFQKAGGVKTLRAKFELASLELEKGKSRSPFHPPTARVRTEFVTVGSSPVASNDLSNLYIVASTTMKPPSQTSVSSGATNSDSTSNSSYQCPKSPNHAAPRIRAHTAANHVTTQAVVTPSPRTPRPISLHLPSNNVTPVIRSTTSFARAHPKLPTRPDKVSPHLLLPTASSAAKTQTHQQQRLLHDHISALTPTHKPTSSIMRRPSVLSTTSTIRPSDSVSVRRGVVGKPTAKHAHSASLHTRHGSVVPSPPMSIEKRRQPVVAVDKSFLARMTRPTQASLGKAVRREELPVPLAHQPVRIKSVVPRIVREKDKMLKKRPSKDIGT